MNDDAKPEKGESEGFKEGFDVKKSDREILQSSKHSNSDDNFDFDSD